MEYQMTLAKVPLIQPSTWTVQIQPKASTIHVFSFPPIRAQLEPSRPSLGLSYLNSAQFRSTSSENMSVSEEVIGAPAPAPAQPPEAPAAEENKPEEPVKKGRIRKKAPPKEKKPKEAKASHPPYFQMIKEALQALQGKSGSSAYAIAKYMEEKHKAELPANFRKILWLQLKNCTAREKLVKVKASFKLSEVGKKSGAAKARASKPVKSERKVKKPEATPKAKKVTGKRTRKAVPAAKPKQPKSIKSASAKKAKKAAPAAS